MCTCCSQLVIVVCDLVASCEVLGWMCEWDARRYLLFTYFVSSSVHQRHVDLAVVVVRCGMGQVVESGEDMVPDSALAWDM